MVKKRKLLLIGNSITEWGRFEGVENLGLGYVRIIHDYLKVSFSSIEYDVINK